MARKTIMGSGDSREIAINFIIIIIIIKEMLIGRMKIDVIIMCMWWVALAHRVKHATAHFHSVTQLHLV